jgi:predicted RNase H-like nuclease (RuvC/YqgF family)
MAFNPAQFKQKKKRAVDPNAPPRPNLLSQDKKLREQQDVISDLQNRLRSQADEIASLKSKYESMQQSISQVLTYLRKGR